MQKYICNPIHGVVGSLDTKAQVHHRGGFGAPSRDMMLIEKAVERAAASQGSEGRILCQVTAIAGHSVWPTKTEYGCVKCASGLTNRIVELAPNEANSKGNPCSREP